MKMKSSSVFLIFILLLMLFSVGISLGFGYYEALLAPLLLSIVIFLLGTIELVRELRSKDIKSQDIADQTAKERDKGSTEMRRFGVALGWMGAFTLGIYILGFFLSTLLFTFTYMKVRGRGWFLSTGFAVGLTVILYGIFETGLRSHLYHGLVFGG